MKKTLILIFLFFPHDFIAAAGSRMFIQRTIQQGKNFLPTAESSLASIRQSMNAPRIAETAIAKPPVKNFTNVAKSQLGPDSETMLKQNFTSTLFDHVISDSSLPQGYSQVAGRIANPAAQNIENLSLAQRNLSIINQQNLMGRLKIPDNVQVVTKNTPSVGSQFEKIMLSQALPVENFVKSENSRISLLSLSSLPSVQKNIQKQNVFSSVDLQPVETAASLDNLDVPEVMVSQKNLSDFKQNYVDVRAATEIIQPQQATSPSVQLQLITLEQKVDEPIFAVQSSSGESSMAVSPLGETEILGNGQSMSKNPLQGETGVLQDASLPSLENSGGLAGKNQRVSSSLQGLEQTTAEGKLQASERKDLFVNTNYKESLVEPNSLGLLYDPSHFSHDPAVQAKVAQRALKKTQVLQPDFENYNIDMLMSKGEVDLPKNLNYTLKPHEKIDIPVPQVVQKELAQPINIEGLEEKVFVEKQAAEEIIPEVVQTKDVFPVVQSKVIQEQQKVFQRLDQEIEKEVVQLVKQPNKGMITRMLERIKEMFMKALQSMGYKPTLKQQQNIARQVEQAQQVLEQAAGRQQGKLDSSMVEAVFRELGQRICNIFTVQSVQ